VTASGDYETEGRNMASTTATMADRFKAIATGHIADALEHLGVRTPCLGPSLRPLSPEARMAGPAVTLELARNRMGTGSRGLAEFLDDVVDEGEVVVIDAKAVPECVLFGERAGMGALNRGAVGAIVNGYCRDVDGMQTLGLPVHACGPALPASEGKLQAVRIKQDVVINGVLIQPGDWIVADVSGVCVVPRDLLERVLELAEEREEIDRETLVEMRAGKGLRDTHRHFRDEDLDAMQALE
jgi:4-hydroxy-4-methyl-2-oxoglutarate aldolase